MLQQGLSDESLWAILPSIAAEDLPSLITYPTAKEQHLIKVLQRPDLPEQFLALVAHSKWAGTLRIQFCLVNHPHTPMAEAMNLTKFLFWRDLTLISQNFRLSSEVRHVAESVLQQRLPAMAVGEKVTLARMAGGQVLKMLRLEKDATVVQALLDNPRLVEEDVLYLVSQQRTPAPVLEAVARDPRWSVRREVRIALLRNARTPLAAAITFISNLNVAELRQLAGDLKVPLAIRKMIQTRLGKSP